MTAVFEQFPTAPGLNTLPSNPCQLLDMQLVELKNKETFQGASGEREILAVVLGGTGIFTVNDQRFENVGGRANVFQGKPDSVYIPRHATFSILALDTLRVALCSAPSELDTAPYRIPPSSVNPVTTGAQNFTRTLNQILTSSAQPDMPASRLIVGETYTPSGNWSTYPPHRHDREAMPAEAFHEEMYLFQVDPPGGFGFARWYEADTDAGYIIRHNSILMVPHGFHTVVSAPGYTVYYLWALAGNHRTQAALDDPAHAWVRDAIRAPRPSLLQRANRKFSRTMSKRR